VGTAFFGAKPKLVLKGGVVNWAVMGDPNASLPTRSRPTTSDVRLVRQLLSQTCVTFVSQAAASPESRAAEPRPAGDRRQEPRKIGKKDMVRNSGTPKIEVSPETFAVTVDGVHATVPPLRTTSLNQKYFFS